MAAAGTSCWNSRQLLSVQLFQLLAPVPLPKKGSLEIKPFIISDRKRCTACLLLLERRAPAAESGSNRIPELHKCPRDRAQGQR